MNIAKELLNRFCYNFSTFLFQDRYFSKQSFSIELFNIYGGYFCFSTMERYHLSTALSSKIPTRRLSILMMTVIYVTDDANIYIDIFFNWVRHRSGNSTNAEEVSKFQRLSLVHSWLMPGKGYRHLVTKNSLQYPLIYSCLMVTGPLVVKLTLVKCHRGLVVYTGANVKL